MLNLTKASLTTALLGALVMAPAAQARTVYGVVVDVDPIRAGGARQVCEPDHRYDRRYDNRYGRDHNNVGGTVAGAVIGGALGNQVGDGSGRTAATVAGAVIGGLAGREIQDRNHNRRYDDRYRGGQRCWTEYDRGGRVTAYEVTYRANGRLGTTRLNYAPRIGSKIRIDTRW